MMIKSNLPRLLTCLVLAAEASAVILNTISPLVQKNLINGAESGERRMVICSAVILAVILLGQFVLRGLSRHWRGVIRVDLQRKLKSSIFRHLLSLPEEFLRSRGAGYFFNRIQHDIAEVTVYAAGSGLLLCGEILKLFLALLFIWMLDFRYGLLVVPFLLLQLFVCGKFRNKQYELSHQLQEVTASERQLMQEYLANHRTLKTHSAASGAEERIDQGLSRWGSLMRKRLGNESLFLCFLQLPIWLASGLIVLSGLYFVLEKQSTLGEVWALLALSNLVFAPSRTLGTVYVQRQAALAADCRLQEICEQSAEEDLAGESKKVDLHGELIFQNVEFGYSKERKVLDDFNFRLAAGQGIFLTGVNGSGKSTVLALLLRLYAPQKGSIFINNRNIADYPLAAYRKRIGYVGQSPEFFPGSLRENLLMDNTDTADEKIMEIFRLLDCEDLILRSPEKLDAAVAERGENYSGGERLRLALVRELLRDTDWLLFDEAAANLDLAGRQKFYALLQNLPGSKSIIAIVHDVPENSTWQVLDLQDLQRN